MLKNILIVESLEELSKKVQEVLSEQKTERIIFERPSWKTNDPKIINEIFDKLKFQKLQLPLTRYAYNFPFYLENCVSYIGYVRFDYIGTFEFKGITKHVVLRNERGTQRKVLEEKLEEFKKAKNCYLPEYYFRVFIIDCFNDDVFLNSVQDSNIVIFKLNDVRSNLCCFINRPLSQEFFGF